MGSKTERAVLCKPDVIPANWLSIDLSAGFDSCCPVSSVEHGRSIWRRSGAIDARRVLPIFKLQELLGFVARFRPAPLVLDVPTSR